MTGYKDRENYTVEGGLPGSDSDASRVSARPSDLAERDAGGGRPPRKQRRQRKDETSSVASKRTRAVSSIEGVAAPSAAAQKTPESSWRRGFRRMDDSDAFEVNDAALADIGRASALLDEDKRQLHMKVGLLSAALILLLFFSLCINVSGFVVISPWEVIQCLGLRIQLFFQSVFTTQAIPNTIEIMEMQPYYYEVSTRFTVSVLTAVCGSLLAMAGMLYQNVFRNPIAAPTMLGVSSGVNLGVLLLVVIWGASAEYMVGARYALCYAGSIAILLIVLLSGRALGQKGSFNVVNMMLTGTVISQLIGTVTSFISYLYMDDALYEVYYSIQQQLDVDTTFVSWIALAVVLVITVVPIYMMRFSLNAMSFADEDSRLIGVNANVLRYVSLICGSVMVIAAMIYCGEISMISLLVPHISRMLFGSEFRKQFAGNLVLGALLLLLCRDISALIPFGDTSLPIGTVVSLVTMPFFVWMIAVQQRSWE